MQRISSDGINRLLKDEYNNYLGSLKDGNNQYTLKKLSDTFRMVTELKKTQRQPLVKVEEQPLTLNTLFVAPHISFVTIDPPNGNVLEFVIKPIQGNTQGNNNCFIVLPTAKDITQFCIVIYVNISQKRLEIHKMIPHEECDFKSIKFALDLFSEMLGFKLRYTYRRDYLINNFNLDFLI